MTPHRKKAIAEVFAGIIPHRQERDRWRGLLRYGPWRLIRLMRRLRKLRRAEKKGKPLDPQYYLAIGAIAKNEGPYLAEWVEWHKAQGVGKFYIYDNESDDNTAEVLAPYVASGLVEYVFWPGKRQQLPAYDDIIDRHRTEMRWLIFLDIDEFIVPVRDETITGYLQRMERHPVVELNWLVYGSGGEREKRPGKVMERFKHHAAPDNFQNRWVKSFIDPRRVCCMTGCHDAARLPGAGYPVDSNGKRTRKHCLKRDAVHDEIRINHYAVKSYEEFLAKRARGRARTFSVRGQDYFDKFDLNDIEEES